MWQKGFDIVAGAWCDLLQRPLRMVVLGTGDHGVQDGLRHLQERDPDRFAVRFAYDECLAHKVMAGSDIFLMPSRSEPCGLTQMYALRYGTIPIVRATGGLVDTVEPYDGAKGTGTGLPLRHARRHGARVGARPGARRLEEPQAWQGLMKRGMAQEFSWERSAREYVALYRRAMGKV